MTPYYTDDSVTLYLGDCREVPEWLEAEVLVTDPPYGVKWRRDATWTDANGKHGHKSHPGSGDSDGDTSTRDAALVLWGGRPGIVFGDFLKPIPPGAVHTLVYAKPRDAGVRFARGGCRRDVEAIYLTGSPWPITVGGRSSVFRTSGRVAGPTGIGVRAGHPHAKPQDVMQELISLTAGAIADPFAGSGSTLVAAKQLGRRAIGVEVDEAYCEVIANRLQQGVLDFGGAA